MDASDVSYTNQPGGKKAMPSLTIVALIISLALLSLNNRDARNRA